MAGYQRPGVYVSEVLTPAPLTSVGSADAAGAIVAPLPKGPETTTLVTSWYQFTQKFGGYDAAFPATFQASMFFQNGGRELYVKRVLASDADTAQVSVVDGDGDTVVNVTSKNRGDSSNLLRVTMQANAASGFDLIVSEEVSATGVSSSVSDDIIRERYERVILDDPNSSDYIETVVNQVSSLVTVSVADANLTPVSSTFPLSGGTDGSAVVADDYAGELSVFDLAFAGIDRPLVIFVPGVDTMSDGDARDVVGLATTWAEASGLGFVVADVPAGKTPAEAATWASALTPTSHLALYYPHVLISDPLGRSAGALRKVGASGAVVGLYLTTDVTRGVHKAPAGVGVAVAGAVAPEKVFSAAELDAMNASAMPLNAIRQVPGAGLVVMGARTTKQDGTANRYVNMRRSLIYIKKNLRDLTQFAVFENNDPRLWEALNTTISTFLNQYRNSGGLRGTTAADAFYVKVDAENNTATTIQNGEVNIEVGVALQYPAEFVVINLSQKTLN